MKRVYIFKDGYSRQAQPQGKVRLTLSASTRNRKHTRCFGRSSASLWERKIYPLSVTEEAAKEKIGNGAIGGAALYDFETEYRRIFETPLEEIKEDIFFRADNFENEKWYGDLRDVSGNRRLQARERLRARFAESLESLRLSYPNKGN